MKENSYKFQIKIGTEDLWRFSMYHSYKGYLGVFNVLFTLASAYLLVTGWNEMDMGRRLLLLVCALLFSVWQPLLLLLKSARQAKGDGMKETMEMEISENGLSVSQAGKKVEISWENVLQIRHIPGIYIFFMGRIHGYLLPDRYVEDPEAFFTYLKKTAPEMCTAKLRNRAK